MTAFFSPIFNHSILQFSVSSGEVVDSRGASVGGIASPIVEFRAYLVRRRTQPRTESGYATEVGVVELEGRMVEPPLLPADWKFGSVGTGIVNGEEGTIELLPCPRDAVAGLEALMGQRIRVRFTQRVSYVGV